MLASSVLIPWPLLDNGPFRFIHSVTFNLILHPRSFESAYLGIPFTTPTNIMHLIKYATSLLLAATSVFALPIEKRDLSYRPYAQFQISDGVCGNALAEAQAKFPVRCALGSPFLISSHVLLNTNCRYTNRTWPKSQRTIWPSSRQPERQPNRQRCRASTRHCLPPRVLTQPMTSLCETARPRIRS